MIRICRLNGPMNCFWITVTSGDERYFDSRFSTSRANSLGVFPVAVMSSTRGIETRPSGRTATSVNSSGFRQTKIVSVSPGPIRYGDVAVSADGAGGGAPPTQPTRPSASAQSAHQKTLIDFPPGGPNRFVAFLVVPRARTTRHVIIT